MRPEFDIYTERYKGLNDLMQDELPRDLRLFNIRLRLALDIVIDFRGEVSLTKTKEVKETYVLIIKLMELWNVYETLIHYAKFTGDYANPKANKAKAYTQRLLGETGSLDALKRAVDNLKTKYTADKRFKKEFDEYNNRIQEHKYIGNILKNDANSIIQYMNSEKDISGVEIVSLIYIERNMYYHNGETARMGMRYSSRKFMINTYKDCFIEHILLLTNFILYAEIQKAK